MFYWISDNSGKKMYNSRIKSKSSLTFILWGTWTCVQSNHFSALWRLMINRRLRVTPPERPKLFFFFCRVSTHFCPYGVSRVYNFAVSSVKLHLFSVALLPQPASVPAGICCLQNISLPLNLTLPRLLQHRPITFLFTHTNWHTHAHTPKQRERTNTTPTQVQKNT